MSIAEAHYYSGERGISMELIKDTNRWILDHNDKLLESDIIMCDHVNNIVVQGDGFEIYECQKCGYREKHYVNREQTSMADGMLNW